MKAWAVSFATSHTVFFVLAGFGALSVLLTEVSLVIGATLLTICATVAMIALSISFVWASKHVLKDNVASANRIFWLSFQLFVACTLSLLAAMNWFRVAHVSPFLEPVASAESTAIARTGFAIYAMTFFLVQNGYCLTNMPNSSVLEVLMMWMQLYNVAFDLVLVPIMTSHIMAIMQEKRRLPTRERFGTPSLMTSVHPIAMTFFLVGVGIGSTILLWTLSPLAGLIVHAVWGVVVATWMWELLYRRVWLSLLRTGAAQPLRDGDSVLDTVKEWLQPAVVGIVGGAMLQYATIACTLLLEKTLAPDRDESKTMLGLPLHENGLVAAVRLANGAVTFSAGTSFGRNEPVHVLSALALVPATLVILAVRVAVLSTGVAGGLAAAASESSKKASRAAAVQL